MSDDWKFFYFGVDQTIFAWASSGHSAFIGHQSKSFVMNAFPKEERASLLNLTLKLKSK